MTRFKKRITSSGGISACLVLFLFFSLSPNILAQNVTNYAYVTGTDASLALDKNSNSLDMATATTQIYGGDVDVYGTAILQNLGFDFIFMGVPYSQFSCNPDGQVRLGASVFTGGHTSSATANLPLIIVNNVDGKTDISGKVHYKVFGSAPNRVMVLEWKDVWIQWNGATTTFSTYQLRLYEGTNEIEMVYGRMYNNATTAQTNTVGFSSSNTSGTVGVLTTLNTTPAFVGNVTSYTTTSFPATSDMVNLNSTTDGSRRFFRFSPNTTITGSVQNLTFSAITPSTTTVNWEDNTTNEVGFAILRATDAAFTQNVQSFFVSSTSVGTTGTAYNLPQTGLSPSTTYFYRVYASVEGGISTPLANSQATSDAAVYYWVGPNNGLWNTFENWNTSADGTGSIPVAWSTTDVHIIDGEGTTLGGDLTISVDRASFTIGQFLITGNTNLTLQSSITTTRVLTISGGTGDDFVIENASSLNLTNANNRVSFVFTGSGNTGLIAGNYTASGGTTTPNNFTTTGGTGTLVRVASTGVVTSNINGSTSGFVGSVATLIFENGSNWIHQNSTTVNYIPAATWEANATATLNGNTTGTSLTSTSPSLGNLIVNTTGSTATLSAFTTAQRIIQGDLTVNNTGTGRFRTVTSGVLQVNGTINLNGGIFEVANGAGAIIAKGNVLVGPGATLDVNQGILQIEGNLVNNGSILSSETTTSSSRINFVLSPNAQSVSGSGSFTGRVSGVGVSNPLGLTISTPVLTQRVNLFTGGVVGSSNITIGTGAALPATVQIGTANNTNPGGNFDTSPIFDLGTGTYTVLYLGETTPRTTGFEIPSSRSITNLFLDNSNGLTIAGGPLEVTVGLTLTNGLVNSTLASHIVHGSATAAGTLTGGSATSYVNGPIVRTINDANANSNYVLFPVGKAGSYNPAWLAPSTTAASRFVVEAFDSNIGTADASISNLSNTRRWEAIKATGSFNDINVRLADATLLSDNVIAHAASASGVYSAPFGSVNTFVAGAPNTIQSQLAVNEVDYAGFLSFATSNACTGAPAPGNTVASNTSICLGESVTLSLQNTDAGTGITYQWYSSPDGVTYTPIDLATSSTLNVTPTMVTYYQNVVTCTNSSQSTTSTPIMVDFDNSIVSTTPDTICGEGQADLSATASSGSTVRWYDASTAGNLLGSGFNFTTPNINTTTTFYAAAQTSTAGLLTLGSGATNSSAVAASFFPGFWGGAKTQYIIRASELAALGLSPGPITSLGFEPTTSGQTYQGFFVSIGHTMQSVASSSFVSSGLTQVFEGSEADNGFTPTANVVNTLNFSTPFVWDGTSNVVVSISWSRVPAATTSTASTMKVDNVGFVSTVYHQADNLTPAQMLAITTSGASTPTSSNRPRFFINGQLLCSSPRVPVIATVTSGPTFTLSSNIQTICNGETTPAVTITAGAGDYDTYVWNPSIGVSGNATSGWSFSPSVSTNYVLTASQSSGSQCQTSTNVQVNVNNLPSTLVLNPTSAETCENEVVQVSVSGGQIGVAGKLGSGTSTNTASTPFKGFFGGNKTQALYTAAELSALGVLAGESINKIGYLALAGTPIVLNDFQIKAGFVTESSVSSTFIAGATTQVFGPVNYTPSGSGAMEFTFATPLVWDGVSNLLIETCFNNNNGGGISANSISVESTTVAAGLITFLSQDNNATVCTNNTPGASTLRPNLLISTLEEYDFVWSPATNLFTDAPATIAYIAGSNASTVYFKGNTTANYTVTVTSASQCSTSANIEIVVNPTPSAPTGDAAQDFCDDTLADLVVVGTNVIWYDLATGGNVLPNSTTLVDGATYYASQTVNGCESTSRLAVTVTEDCPIAGCLIATYGQWPSGPITPATCDGVTVNEVTPEGWAGEYSRINVVSGQTYTFSSSVSSDFITIGNADGTTVFASGTGSVTWVSTVTGQIRFYTHVNAACGDAMVERTRSIICGIPSTDAPDYVSLQWPPSINIDQGGSGTVYGQVYEAGLTDVVPNIVGQAPGITAWVGISPVGQNTNPNTWTTWVPATWNSGHVSNNDEYEATIGATLAPGTYYYATRFRLNAGPFVYGGIDSNNQGNFWDGTAYISGVLTVTPAPAPANDLCADAAPLTVGLNFAANATTGTILGATTTAGLTPTCQEEFGFDVWYSVVVPASGNLTIETKSGTTNGMTDSVVTVYSGSCGALTQVGCDDDSGDGFMSLLNLTGQTPGSVLYVAVWKYGVAVPGTTNSNFLVSAYDADLSVGGFDSSKFSYYPNPVQDVLTLNYSQTISEVTVFNMLGQQVITKQNNDVQAQVSLNSLPNGTYLVRVVSENESHIVKVIKN
ncbi:T9SS type A sorting domain-containing protein [Flavobacterium sp. UBA6135]|uniref:Ig-like domain-containing protein n=1 Tax=Flavobacterium sp. UBA6135 TaxID=1946553 RepID=UPI0025C2DD2A|nr:T9SS type A sorting domain-containing protein [Flavobacterium sp. UBA6135]